MAPNTNPITAKSCLGEIIGTFILVFFGCGSVAGAVLFNIPPNLILISIVWGTAIALGILLVRKFSKAHFNPAVTVGMLTAGEINFSQALAYVASQYIGATIAACALYMIFNKDIAHYELSEQIVRGSLESRKSAMMFGEFFPNPGNPSLKRMTIAQASLLEATGTFMLLTSIFLCSSSTKKWMKHAAPWIIGYTVSLLICLIAPYTQAGFNPARDLAPRVVSFFFGWGQVVFQKSGGSLITYVLAPIIGSVCASVIVPKIINKTYRKPLVSETA